MAVDNISYENARPIGDDCCTLQPTYAEIGDIQLPTPPPSTHPIVKRLKNVKKWVIAVFVCAALCTILSVAAVAISLASLYSFPGKPAKDDFVIYLIYYDCFVCIHHSISRLRWKFMYTILYSHITHIFSWCSTVDIDRTLVDFRSISFL